MFEHKQEEEKVINFSSLDLHNDAAILDETWVVEFLACKLQQAMSNLGLQETIEEQQEATSIVIARGLKAVANLCSVEIYNLQSMGGCSSKPRTAEPEVQSPAKRELNLLLSGLKAIDPSNSSYKGSQHTLQSLFVQHHKDGEDVLHVDGNTEIGSKGLQQQQQEPENKHSSPKSVLTHLTHQDTENSGKTEEGFLPLEASKPAATKNPSHEDDNAPSVSAEQQTEDHAVSETTDCKIHGVLPEPKHTGQETNLSSSIPAGHVLYDSRASEAKESFATNVPALGAEAAESINDRHEQELEAGQNPGKLASETNTDGTANEHAIEGAVESHTRAETELGDAMGSLEAHKLQARREEATMEVCEQLVVHHVECFPKSCSESEENAPKEIDEKAMEAEKAVAQSVDGEKTGPQDSKPVEGDKAAVQDKEDYEYEKSGVQDSEGPMQEEGKDKELTEACIQDTVTNVLDEHPGFPDRVYNEENVSVEAAVTMQNHEMEEIQGGRQSTDEKDVSSDDKSSENYGQLKQERGLGNVLPSHVSKPFAFSSERKKERAVANVLTSDVDSKAVTGESASRKSIEESINCEVKEELEFDQGMLTNEENNINQTDLGHTGKVAFAEASSCSAVGADAEDMVLEKLEAEKKSTEGTNSSENESPKVVSEEVASLKLLPADRHEVFEHEQQTHDSPVKVELDKKDPVLSLKEDMEADSAASKDRLLESDSTDKHESKTGAAIEFKNSVDDDHGKQDESFQLSDKDQSDVNQSSVELESIHRKQIEKSIDGLDSNIQTDVEADGLPRADEKESLANRFTSVASVSN
ncbi:hypothetical protein L7F22_004738 [Adiantum nelumboides]|nr:hypothetical protein [Adiantum nelumboides]